MNEDVKIEGETEIAAALKEFEVKYKAEIAEEVSEVSKASEVPRMVQLVIKFSGGAIKNQRQAEYVLLGIVLLMLAVSFYLFFGGKSSPAPTPVNTGNVSQPPFVQ